MRWTFRNRWRWPALSLLASSSLPGLSGCHQGLQPNPVIYPPPPPLVCPSLPPRGAACAGEHSDDKEPAAPLPGEPQLIDLPTALRLADVQNPEIAVARERIREALAVQERAEWLWMPNLEVGPTWMRHDGQIQRSAGDVFTTSRSSLFIGGGPALNWNMAEVIYAPLAARRLTTARRAGAAGVANVQLLDVALAYIDLLQVYAELQINEETLQNARQLQKLTESFQQVGKGAAADTARARTEVYRRERQRVEIQGRIALASARLVQLLQLPPQFLMQPLEPAVVPIALVSEEMSLDDLLTYALTNRPELAENRAIILAALETWRAAKVAPWVPNLRLSYAAGGFGGGMNGFFDDFNGRGDATATMVWHWQNFGFGNAALTRERRSQYAQATFRQAAIEAQVSSQIVSAFSVAFARRKELAASQREVAAARESYRLNEEKVRRYLEKSLPIELLQAIQALAQARQDYLQVVADYNRAQFRLYTALGNPPLCALQNTVNIPVTEPTVPFGPDSPEQLPPPKPIRPGEPKPG